MIYIENILICLSAPMVIAILCVRKEARKSLMFLLTGMGACLLSSYISTFLATIQGADLLSASLEIAPVVEETMKLFPVLFYLLIFEPPIERAVNSFLMVSIGFATLENVCYLVQNEPSRTLYYLIRGFGTGSMHVVCAFIMAAGMLRLWGKEWIRVAGTIGLLATVITLHGVYNILVSQPGPAAIVGYLIPIVTSLVGNLLRLGPNLRAPAPED